MAPKQSRLARFFRRKRKPSAPSRAPVSTVDVASPLRPAEVQMPEAPAPEPEEDDGPDEAAAGAAGAAGAAASGCPAEMVKVEGEYCDRVQQDCLEWMDQEIPLEARKRCARFAPSKCIGGKRRVSFCIDRLENATAPDEIPTGDISWTLSRDQCEARGKRLCFEPEWTYACEGPEMLPYPYGLERDARRCNHDRTDLVAKNKMLDHRKPASSNPTCLSPFGVQNMVGNVDEWVVLEKGYPPQRSGLKGGWWLAGRNRCRPTTGGHDEYFHEVQTGYRCCKDLD